MISFANGQKIRWKREPAGEYLDQCNEMRLLTNRCCERVWLSRTNDFCISICSCDDLGFWSGATIVFQPKVWIRNANLKKIAVLIVYQIKSIKLNFFAYWWLIVLQIGENSSQFGQNQSEHTSKYFDQCTWNTTTGKPQFFRERVILPIRTKKIGEISILLAHSTIWEFGRAR